MSTFPYKGWKNRLMNYINHTHIIKNKLKTSIFIFDSKLDHNSVLHEKITEISVIKSRIEFPDPMLMTLDRGKISGKIIKIIIKRF